MMVCECSKAASGEGTKEARHVRMQVIKGDETRRRVCAYLGVSSGPD